MIHLLYSSPILTFLSVLRSDAHSSQRTRRTPSSSTHTFNNHSDRVGVSRLERGSNHWEPTPLTLDSRCGGVGPLLRPGECTSTTTPDSSGAYDETRGCCRPQIATGLFTESPFPALREGQVHTISTTTTTTTSRQSSQRRSVSADQKTATTTSVSGRTDKP